MSQCPRSAIIFPSMTSGAESPVRILDLPAKTGVDSACGSNVTIHARPIGYSDPDTEAVISVSAAERSAKSWLISGMEARVRAQASKGAKIFFIGSVVMVLVCSDRDLGRFRPGTPCKRVRMARLRYPRSSPSRFSECCRRRLFSQASYWWHFTSPFPRECCQG